MNELTDSGQIAPLQIDSKGTAHLEEARKWAHFLSIIGFIGIGLMLMLFVFFSAFMPDMMNQTGAAAYPSVFPTVLVQAIFLISALIYFFPVYFLNRYAAYMKAALHRGDQEMLNQSFLNLKRLFRFMGVITIFILALYVVVIAASIVMGVMRG